MTLGNEPQAVVQTSKGVVIALDQLVVRFQEGTSEARIREIVNAVGGVVTGTGDDLIFFRVSFNPIPKTLQELNLKGKQLKAFPEVKSVELNLRIGSIHSISPANDPLLAITGGQDSPFKSRADEAWWVTSREAYYR